MYKATSEADQRRVSTLHIDEMMHGEQRLTPKEQYVNLGLRMEQLRRELECMPEGDHKLRIRRLISRLAVTRREYKERLLPTESRNSIQWHFMTQARGVLTHAQFRVILDLACNEQRKEAGMSDTTPNVK